MSSLKEDGEAWKAAERLRLALEMFGLGEDMMRRKLAREHPGAAAEEVERMGVRFALVGAWHREGTSLP